MLKFVCYFAYNFLDISNQSFFMVPMDVLFVYHKFDYKCKNSNLIVCTRWLSRRKKI